MSNSANKYKVVWIKNIENSTTTTTTTTTTATTITSTTSSSTISTTNPKSTICDVQENEEEEKIKCNLTERPVTSVAAEETLSLTSSSISKLVTIEESTNESVGSNKATTSLNSTLHTNTTPPTLPSQQQQQQQLPTTPAGTNLWTQSVTSINSITTPVIKVVDDVSIQQIVNDTDLTKSVGAPISTSNPTDSPHGRKSSTGSKGKPAKIAPSATSSKISLNSQLSNSSSVGGRDEDNAQSRVSEPVAVEAFVRGTSNADGANNAAASQTSNEKPVKSTSRLSERAKKKSWYNVIYPNYKSRAEDFKKLFKDVPNDERLIVDYSCALQRDILVQGRLYVSQNYVCFHANIFSWETYVSIKWKEVTAITKEKTALVIPNAISICTANEKYFFATFTSRDKSFLMLFRVWQNTLMNKQFSPQEIWRYVHNCYGDELGLTTDDEDYIDPTIDPADTETDLEFSTAVDDSASACMSVTSDYNTANTNSSQSINQQLQTSGNSSASSGGGGVRKSRTKSYFFNSGKSSNLNSSTNASASGSDNKESIRKSNKKMKSNAKELTLSSVKPEEQTVAVTFTGGGSGSETKQKSSTTAASSNSQVAAAVATTSHDAKRKISKSSRQREDAVSKNAEAVPTDASDSSDSEDNKIPFVATTECTSTHEGRQILHTILPINVETLFSLLFSKSKFLTDFHTFRKSTDLSFGDWSTSDEGLQTRVFSVTVQLAASVGPKTSKVTEYQTMRECSKPGELYSIDVNSVNAGIPYADSFSVLLHFCLVRTVDDHTMLSVHAQIKYKKSIWGVVKGFIEKNTWAGLEDFFTALLHALQSETCIPPAKGKGRRPRRGTATQIRPLDDNTMSTAQIKNEAIESTSLVTNSSAHMPQTHLGGIGIAGKPLTTHQHQQQHQQDLLQEHNKEHKTKYKGISLFVIFLMCCLLALNVILLLKLWKLEEHIDVDLSRRARIPNFAALKEMPNTNQDWLELLRQQELLHETELRKWHHVLQTAIELLKKVSVVCERIYNDGKLKQEIADLHYEF